MAPSSSSSAGTTSVQVALRIRPPTSQDSTTIPARFQRSVIQTTSSTSVSIESPSNALAGTGAPAVATSTAAAGPKKQSFNFDQVHPPPASQYEVFESTARPLVSRFLEGFNCTVLAYGQTSSGKTYTMTGMDLDADPSDPNTGMGIIPRAVSSIFLTARKTKEERGTSWGYNLKASFIEIYNEDLIDLLSLDDPAGVRREVQIREDKEGHIIWGGLREVNVKNTYEVMSLLKKGTSLRQTNETDMNAQSSRSHAIFSLTFTQKKFTGSGQPPRSSSPLPPGGRSPSRLVRPGSMYSGPSPVANGISSPLFGRPSTPSSFVSAIGRGGLRPASALGHQPERSTHDDDRGDWVTIVSKFHFVDLAGSERLKRTAAVGERIKEGISINSGLLALGNVISALGDPARSKTTTHIPYRDSKLTRLLQDSLGGNAHTLMIACVSPAEWNAGETINTLKYANRARNIKNRAVLNEKEDGWEDVDWLQGTVTRLRKELKVLKEGGVIPERKEPEVVEGAGKRVLAQLTELQNSYEDLREKFVERTEELTRLRRELGEKHRYSTSGAVNSTAKYEEIVGPVIEEYEKTISAMEAELNLNRAALRHTNEMFEEKEEEFTAITERHAATELYVEELRVRVAKLTEREASTEAYVRDLEERMKTYDETSVSSSESLTDLKRELARFKESEVHSSKYIVDLEARLSRSDESILALQQNIENLEKESECRREEAENLQRRLENLTKDGENWRSHLEAREARVKELEQKLSEWEQKRKEAEETRARLGEVVGEVVSAKRNLEVDISNAGSAVTSISPSPVQSEQPLPFPLKMDEQKNSPESDKEELEKQLLELQHTHTATLADLASITVKYRDALREISDLASQIQEAKLNPTITEVAEGEDPRTDSPSFDILLDTPPVRRRKISPRIWEVTEGPLSPTNRRHFFRQAASAESLHARSLSQSQSLSQELSSVHSRKPSSSAGSSHSRSNSYSMLRPAISLPHTPVERSVTSLEKEIMRLQEVLRDREAEITTLEQSFKETQQGQQQPVNPVIVNGVDVNHVEDGDDADSTSTGEGLDLSPKTLNQFESIRKTMENGQPDALSSQNEDESLERLNELMLSMAQKESQHKEVVDDITSKLHQTRRQLDELTTLSRDQALNMSMEIEALQRKHHEDLTKLQEVEKHEAQLVEALEEAEKSHTMAMETLRIEHEEVLTAKSREIDELITSLKREHETDLSSVRNELELATAILEKAKQDHEAAFGQLVAEQAKELQTRLAEANTILEETRASHEKVVAKLQAEHVTLLRQKNEEASSTLQTTEEEYYNALTKLRNDHAESIRNIASETNATVERLREEYSAELRMAEIAKEGSLSESESARTVAVKTLQEEHAAAIVRKDLAFTEEIECLNAGFARASKAKDGDHLLQMDRLKLEHETTISKLKSDWCTEVDRLNAAMSSEADQQSSIITKHVQEKESAVRAVQDQQQAVLQEVVKGHEAELLSLEEKRASGLKELMSKAEKERTLLMESHTQEVLEMKTRYEEGVAKLEAALISVQVSHKQAGDEEIEHQKQTLANERIHFAATLEDLQRQHQEEQAEFRKDREVLVHELEAYKAAADQFTILREQTRQAHEKDVEAKTDIIISVEQNVVAMTKERDELANEVEQLRAELERTRTDQSNLIEEAHKRESLVMEIDHHRSVLADLQENVQKVKDEKDILQTEKNKAESLIRDLQAQLARSASPPNARSPDRVHSFRGVNGLPAMKLPPPTPPPSVPPPPAPRSIIHLNGDSIVSTSSQTSTITTATTTSSKESQPESPATSIGHTPLNGAFPLDLKGAAKLEQQTKQIEEQEAMIKTLNKQLMHCETDLQTHMDLVSTLETSLAESEKNLRKARMQATEIARERDTMSFKTEALRNELEQAKREVANVRRSIVEEKQSLEQRLDEERKAKERVRQQLDSRMDELQRRKSKFACL